jgi:nucleotide-binding universal stress UspA family protein
MPGKPGRPATARRFRLGPRTLCIWAGSWLDGAEQLPQGQDADDREARAMTETEPGRQVVVAGIDGSPESVAALGWAARYAAATGATVRAVRAWHFPNAAGFPPEGKAPEPVRAEIEQRMRDEVGDAIAKANIPPSVPVETEIGYGHPAQVLIDASGNADLLVVGHRGHGGFSEMLTGSVALHCVSHAACPVVVIRGS